MPQTIDEMKSSGDLTRFDAPEDDVSYFSQIGRAIDLATRWHKTVATPGSPEDRLVSGLMKRLSGTQRALSQKFSFNTGERVLTDQVDSGFWHSVTLVGIETDLRTRADRLAALPSSEALREHILSGLLNRMEDDRESLAKMAELSYLRGLSREDILLCFSFGELEKLPDEDGSGERRYIASFASFSREDNTPYFYLLQFTQDRGEPPLEEMGQPFEEFLGVITQECNSVPKIGQLAYFLDERLKSIHPKVLRRINLRVLSPRYSRDPNPEPMVGFLRDVSPDDVALRIESQTVTSLKQVERRTNLFGFGAGKKVREIFDLPEFGRGKAAMATLVTSYVVFPHVVYQLKGTDPDFVSHYCDTKQMVYDREGGTFCV